MGSPPAAMRGRVLASLAELVAGGMAERMRRDAAARVLVAARQVMALATAGYGHGLRAAPPGRDARLVMDLATAWEPVVLTAAEFIEALTPAEIDALLAAARPWATQVWDTALPLPEAEKRRRLAMAG